MDFKKLTLKQRQNVELPKMKCKKGCSECCGVIPWREDEYFALPTAVRAKYPHAVDTTAMKDTILVYNADGSTNCPFLKNNKCDIYKDRPMICRVFGVVNEKGLLCPEGCKPKHFMRKGKADALLFG